GEGRTRRRRKEGGPVANSPHTHAIAGSVRQSGGGVSRLSPHVSVSRFREGRRPCHGPLVIGSAKGRWAAGGKPIEHRRDQQDGLWPRSLLLRHWRGSNRLRKRRSECRFCLVWSSR